MQLTLILIAIGTACAVGFIGVLITAEEIDALISQELEAKIQRFRQESALMRKKLRDRISGV